MTVILFQYIPHDLAQVPADVFVQPVVLTRFFRWKVKAILHEYKGWERTKATTWPSAESVFFLYLPYISLQKKIS